MTTFGQVVMAQSIETIACFPCVSDTLQKAWCVEKSEYSKRMKSELKKTFLENKHFFRAGACNEKQDIYFDKLYPFDTPINGIL